MIKFSNGLKISFGFLLVHIVVIIILFGFAASPWIQRNTVNIQSNSMVNSNDDSIHDGDLLIVEDLDNIKDVTSYVEGVTNGHRKAGSYGDVIVAYYNGEKGKTPIVARAVAYIEFNSTTYDPETRDGGGYDIPFMGLWNVMSTFTIENYEWPKRPNSRDETIDMRSILSRFKALGETPHSGFLTKGDDNDHVDQVSSFGGSEPAWIEPVKEKWILGIFKSKVQDDPATVSCCFFLMISPLSLTAVIVLFVRDLRSAKREEKERDVPYYGGPPNRRGHRPAGKGHTRPRERPRTRIPPARQDMRRRRP
jgi:hypothetical protein